MTSGDGPNQPLSLPQRRPFRPLLRLSHLAFAFLRQHRFVAGAGLAVAVVSCVGTTFALSGSSNASGSEGRVVGNSSDTSAPADTPQQPTTNQLSAEPAVGQDSSSSSSTNVTINGQAVPVPENGSYHHESSSDGSHTSVNVENHQSQSSTSGSGGSVSNHASSNVNIQVRSNSRTESNQ